MIISIFKSATESFRSAARANVLRDALESMEAHVESYVPDGLGVQLAYLSRAVLIDSYIELLIPDEEHVRVFKVMQQVWDEAHPIWKWIRISAE